MTDINTVTITGRLVRDIEVSYSNSGFAIGRVTIACSASRKVGDKWEDETHYFDATILGKRAEGLSQYLVKGKQVALTGRLQQERWEKDGMKHSKVKILVESLVLGGGNNTSTEYNRSKASRDIPY